MFLRAALEPSAGVADELRHLTRGLMAFGLRPVPPEAHGPVLARFGNVTPDVAVRLDGALFEWLAGRPPCEAALAGPRLDGDKVVVDLVDEEGRLQDLVVEVGRIAEAKGIFVDRRVVGSGMTMATIGSAQAAEAIRSRLEQMAPWRSSTWTVGHLVLTRTIFRGNNAVPEHWRTVEFALVADDAPAG